MSVNNKKIVSVQDISCFGQCSLTVALPILSAHGIETAILPSAIMSNHTGGFSGYTCLDLTDEMPKIVNQWKKEGITFDAIYTGYIGDARQFDIIRSLKELLVPGGKLIVDPAMADHGKMYKALGPDIFDGMLGLVKEADMILPNLTEAAMLLGREYREDYTEEELKEMAKALSDLGPETVILTGASFAPDQIGSVAYERSSSPSAFSDSSAASDSSVASGASVISGLSVSSGSAVADSAAGSFVSYMGRKMPRSYHGTGDIFASTAIAAYLNGKDLLAMQQEACEFVISCIKNTIGDPQHSYGVRFESVLSPA